MIIDPNLDRAREPVAANRSENHSAPAKTSTPHPSSVDKRAMLKKIETLERTIAEGGWTDLGVHRLIALVEEDGIESPRERRALQTLLAEDRFVGTRSRGELASFLGFIERAQAKTSRPTLFGLGARDLDPARYRRHVEILAGEKETTLEGKKIRFTDRYLPSVTHQLDEVAAWLSNYYRALGFKVELQPILWEGRTYSNVIATIPGNSKEKVLLCDHYDVADKEHLLPCHRERFYQQLTRDHGLSAQQISKRAGKIPAGAAVAGADDNASASAALMEMGAVMREVLDSGIELGRTIELVHLVGEELPADCLGARAYVERARREKQAIAAVLLMDMIGVDRTGKRKVQLSPGNSPGALELAAEVKRGIVDLHLELKPILRPYGSRKSFLHQTDGIHFSKADYPVVLLNEHLNDDHDLYRAGYHDEFDTTALITFDYAADIARAALETAYRCALPRSPKITNKR